MFTHLENLERRAMLSASVVNGVLTINGTAGTDTYLITQVGDDLHVTENNVNLGSFAVDDDGSPHKALIELYAGGGNDVVVLDASVTYNSELYGQAGHDAITGGSGQDDIDGGAGNDTMHGGADDDTFYNNNTPAGIAGPVDKDEFYGDAGDEDSVRYDDRPVGVVVTLDDIANDGYATAVIGGASPEGDNVHSDVEGVGGTEFADYLVGNAKDNGLFGSGGNDTIYGSLGNDTLGAGEGNDTVYASDGNDWILAGGGNDWISAGSGNDTINGSAGSDTMFGGLGTDTADYTNHTAAVVVRLDGLQNDGAVGEMDWIKSDVENVVGTQFADHITGSAAANFIDGKQGNDTIRGLDGNDTLIGGFGNDRIFGGIGDDSIQGNQDNDSLFGEAGTDVLDGGAGVNLVVQ